MRIRELEVENQNLATRLRSDRDKHLQQYQLKLDELKQLRE